MIRRKFVFFFRIKKVVCCTEKGIIIESAKTKKYDKVYAYPKLGFIIFAKFNAGL